MATNTLECYNYTSEISRHRVVILVSTPWFWGQEIHQDQLDYHLAIRQSKIHHGVQNGRQMGKLAAKCISTPKIEGNYFITYISSMTKIT